MRAPMTRLLVFLYLLAGVAQQAVAQADQQRAQEYFKDLKGFARELGIYAGENISSRSVGLRSRCCLPSPHTAHCQRRKCSRSI